MRRLEGPQARLDSFMEAPDQASIDVAQAIRQRDDAERLLEQRRRMCRDTTHQSVVQQRTVDDKVRSGIISVEKLYNVLGQKLDPVGNPIPEERFKTNLKKSIGMLKERRGRTLLKSRDLVMNFVLKTFENDPSQFENLFNAYKAYRQSQVSSTGQAE